jgi:hypothetical protein
MLFMLFATCGFGQSKTAPKPATPKDNGPSLDETTVWLKEKIASYSGVSLESDDGRVEKGVSYSSTATFDGCHLTLTTQAKSLETEQPVGSTIYAMDVQDIDPKTIGVRKMLAAGYHRPGGGAYYTVTLAMIGNQARVQMTNIVGAGHGYKVMKSEVNVDLNDEDIANRAAKALVHAVQLCQAQHPEPF